jgi:hypothetical protein
MPTLRIKSEGFEGRVLKLKLGTNRLGRSPKNDFQIEHPTVSATHCEIDVVGDCLVVRDCGSTNGTFVNGQPVVAARLSAGRSLHLGEVELVAENVDAAVNIPRFEVPPAEAPPVVLADGALICPRHPGTKSTYRCLHCREVMCDDCVRQLGRRGGKVYKLCPKCSNHCEHIGGRKKKRSLLELLKRTIK